MARLERVHGFVRRLHDKELPDSSISVSYSFAHVLYQHAIDENLAPSRKAALSLAAGEAVLLRHRASPSSAASRLAMLFEAAHDFERAADFFILAAVNAAAFYANEEALNLSRRAIANAEKLHGLCVSRTRGRGGFTDGAAPNGAVPFPGRGSRFRGGGTGGRRSRRCRGSGERDLRRRLGTVLPKKDGCHARSCRPRARDREGGRSGTGHRHGRSGIGNGADVRRGDRRGTAPLQPVHPGTDPVAHLRRTRWRPSRSPVCFTPGSSTTNPLIAL